MGWGVVLRNAIVGLTALSCGFIIWLAVANLRAGRRYGDPAPAFYAMARFGIVLVIGLVAEAVFASPELPVNIRTVLYTLGLLMLTVGYAGVLVFEHKRPRHSDVDRKIT